MEYLSIKLLFVANRVWIFFLRKQGQNDCCIDSSRKLRLICGTGFASIAFGYPNAVWENPKPLYNYDKKGHKKIKKWQVENISVERLWKACYTILVNIIKKIGTISVSHTFVRDTDTISLMNLIIKLKINKSVFGMSK